MTNTRVAGLTTIVFALASIAWFALEGTPVRLGFDDTDDPSVMLAFIRQHPEVFVQAGMSLLLMAASLTVAVLAVGEVIRPTSGALAARSVSAFGLFAAALFLFGGAVRIGSSGPLLHMAGLREAWGEAAYVAAQVGSQAVFIGGILAVCLWAVGLSLIGLRTAVIPRALCLLGVLPAFRIVSGLIGPLGLAPDNGLFWVLSLASILGTTIWCLVLGIVLLRRSVAGRAELALERGIAAT